jgi:superfamily I DNA and/or RNA helicase
MIYSREEHISFLEEELRAQTEAFRQKLESPALYLLHEREELFVAQFIKFQDGEMILRFSNKRGTPRQGEYLYCITVPKELRDYRNWDNKTYGDLIKVKDNFTDAICIWQAPSNEEDFIIAGFRGVELEFANHIQEAEGMILVLGPKKPPFEYIANLQKIVNNKTSNSVDTILDQNFNYANWTPSLLDGKSNIVQFIQAQLQLQDSIIIQGPPGTGKTYLIAELIEKLTNENKSVLVTALTNRALIEIAEKPALKNHLIGHRIYKTKLSIDETKIIPDLKQTNVLSPQPGNVILSTFFITSGQASQITKEQPFDYVVVDEASQALLAMFAGAALLGKKNIWIGDTKQLPPVVSISEDKIYRKNYGVFVDGFKVLTDNASFPIFQLSESYRLPERAIKYTGIFYKNTLKSKVQKSVRLNFNSLLQKTHNFINTKGGPVLIKTDLPVGDFKPKTGLNIVVEIVEQLLSLNENLHISVLSYFVETTKALQKHIYQNIGHNKYLLIETVSRIQGLTTDICIFFIPNSSYHRSLENRLFNVATSRAKRHTIIISDKNILSRTQIDTEVKEYLQQLDNDFSIYIKAEPKQKMLT